MRNSCFWITGLPGSGKTTIGNALKNLAFERYEILPVMIDGDEIRNVLNNYNYDPESRIDLALTYSKLCKLFVEQGHMVICTTVSLYQEVWDWNRKNIPGYCEIYLNESLDILAQRNKKNLYKAGLNNMAQTMHKNMLSNQVPAKSHIEIKNPTALGIENSLNKIRGYLQW